jgi:hypothetical protein
MATCIIEQSKTFKAGIIVLGPKTIFGNGRNGVDFILSVLEMGSYRNMRIKPLGIRIHTVNIPRL